MRGEVCLYVGSTVEGPASRLRHHHVINRAEPWREGDRIEVWLVSGDLTAFEQDMIRALCPTLNTRVPPEVARAQARVRRQRR